MCKLHDKFYNDNHDTASRNVSDLALAHRANEIANDSRYDSTQRSAASIVALIMKNKARFGLGLTKQTSKNLKKGPMKTYCIDNGVTWKIITLPVDAYEFSQIGDKIQRQMIGNGDYNKNDDNNNNNNNKCPIF